MPAPQLLQLAAPAFELVPAGQDEHAEVPPGDACPALQEAQTRSLVAEPEALTPEPAEQVLHLVQLALFSASLNEPAAHALQVRSAVADPTFDTY